MATAEAKCTYAAKAEYPAGKTITFHVYCPAGNAVSAVQPYALQGAAGGWGWTGSWKAMSSLKAGAWNAISLTLPSNAASPLAQLGVQCTTSAAWSGTCYVDSVAW